MRSIISASLLLLIFTTGYSQEMSKKEMKQLQKQLRKEQKDEETEKKAAVVTWMIESRRFVLEADRLRDKMGNTINVHPTINFIASDSVTGVLQIGSNGYVGMNGVGGFTVEGKITNYKYTRNSKNGTYNVSYNVQSTTGTYDVRFTAFPEGRAEATITSNWPGRLIYMGYLIPPHLSKVYKGISY